MKTSVRKGFGFGLTSGIITTLGMMVGLNSSTHSIMIVISGILIIAIADSFSDALGIHISEECETKRTQKEIWESTITTFASKLFFALTFIVPVLLFELQTAIIVSIIWGLSLIALLSYYIARISKVKSYKIILEHVLIAIVVITATHYIGTFISSMF
ncbi:MAG: VIT1/CCC1 transporter family protein [archaeon]|nr:hypothetical protein [Nanoarchaeota archaeon]